MDPEDVSSDPPRPTLSGPRVKTIKRLFAVCRNSCAFPGCVTPIVDADGNVLGEICHIAAQNVGGPRYDTSQDDETRHGFDNLLLLCGNHHKVIDDDEIQYSVAVLAHLKATHEKGAQPAYAPNEVVQELLRKAGGQVYAEIRGGDNSVNVAAANSTLVVNQGISPENARQIALDVFRANCLELRDVAQKVAWQRAEELTDAFLSRLAKEPPEAVAQLADPDMQHVLFVAQREAARAGQAPLSEVLVDLLTKRAKQAERDLLQIVLNESIETASRVTIGQLDALTLIFVLGYTRNLQIRNLEDLKVFFESTISPFALTAASSSAAFQHLEAVRCGSIGITQRNIQQYLTRTYPHCFLKRLPVSEIRKVLNDLDFDILKSLGLFVISEGEDEAQIVPAFDILVEEALKKSELSVSENALKDYYGKLGARAFSDADDDKLSRELHGYADLKRWYEKQPSHFNLTSVGISLAVANLARKGITDYELKTWIN